MVLSCLVAPKCGYERSIIRIITTSSFLDFKKNSGVTQHFSRCVYLNSLMLQRWHRIDRHMISLLTSPGWDRCFSAQGFFLLRKLTVLWTDPYGEAAWGLSMSRYLDIVRIYWTNATVHFDYTPRSNS